VYVFFELLHPIVPNATNPTTTITLFTATLLVWFDFDWRRTIGRTVQLSDRRPWELEKKPDLPKMTRAPGVVA
jgi:hypothetical protein